MTCCCHSRDEYNLASNLISVCPITSADKDRPYFVPIYNEKLSENSKVNTKQVYSLDYTEQCGRKVQMIGKVTKKRTNEHSTTLLFKFQL